MFMVWPCRVDWRGKVGKKVWCDPRTKNSAGRPTRLAEGARDVNQYLA